MIHLPMSLLSRRSITVCCILLALTLSCREARAASETSRLLAAMSLEEKVGQIFMLWFKGPVASGDAAALIRDHHVGGLILYATAGNIESPEQVARLTADMQAAAAASGHGVGVLVGVDQEGGPVARLRQGFTVFPSQMAQAATGRADLARRAAAATARELATVGINVDFAPVADVNINPANPVIGIRSFGSDPATAARFAAAATTGYRNAGVICTPKHFPGHGDTSVDSHVGLPRVDHDLRTLDRVDFPPFRAALAAGAPAVMTAHVLAPALEPKGLPATLSRRVLGGWLRGRMGFSGVIFTDSLGMGAVADTWGTAEAAVLALEAGADILLVGADAGRPASERLLAMDAVIQAVRSGRVPAKRLDAAVARVLRLKERYGLLAASRLAEPAPDAARRTDTPQNIALARRIAVRALTAFGPTKPALPAARTASTLVVRPRLGRDAIDALAEAGIDAWSGPHALFLPSDPDATAIAQAEAAARQASKVILLATNARKYPGQRRLAESLAQAAPGRLILVAAESPYDLPLLPNAAARLAIYGETPAGMAALEDALFTTQLFGGRCPATIMSTTSTAFATQ